MLWHFWDILGSFNHDWVSQKIFRHRKITWEEKKDLLAYTWKRIQHSSRIHARICAHAWNQRAGAEDGLQKPHSPSNVVQRRIRTDRKVPSTPSNYADKVHQHIYDKSRHMLGVNNEFISVWDIVPFHPEP